MALVFFLPSVISVISTSGEFSVTPDIVYINWTNGGFGSYTTNITINLTKNYGAGEISLSIGNSSTSAILVPIYYGILNINISECYFSGGDAKFTNKIPCDRLIIIPNNISNFTYGVAKNFSLTFNYTFLLQYPGRYKTYKALTVFNTTNFTEQANLTVYVDIPVLFLSDQKSFRISSYKLPGGSKQSFSIPANNKGREDAHFYYINTSNVENVSGIYINISDPRLAIFLFDEKESTILIESKNISGFYEIFSSSPSPLSGLGKLYIYGNDTNDIPYESYIILSTLYSYNASNISQIFGFNNKPYKVNFSSGEKIFSSKFVLKNKGIFNYSNLEESKEVYFVSGYVDRGYGNNTYWVMIPENTMNIIISLKFNSSGNYSIKLFDPNNKKVSQFFYDKGYYEEIVGKRKISSNYTGGILPGLWRIEVINISGISDFNLTIYSQLPESMIKTNYSLYSNKNIKYHGSGDDSKPIDLTLYVNKSGVPGYYTSYIYYREGNKNGIKIPFNTRAFGSTPLIDYRFKEKVFYLVENLERYIKMNITFLIQNAGNYNITNIVTTYKDLIMDSQNYINITNIFINGKKYTGGEFTIENNTWIPVNVEIEINKSVAKRDGIYSGYVFFNMSKSIFKPTPYDYVKAIINLNLTKYIIVNSTSLFPSKVNATASPKNISVIFKAYYANGSAKVSNEIELENITLVKIIHKNVSNAFKDVTSSKYYYTGTTIWSGSDYQFNITIPKGIWGGYYDLILNFTLKDTNRLIGSGKAILKVNGEALAIDILYHPTSMKNGTESWLNISLTNYGLNNINNAQLKIDSNLIQSATFNSKSGNCNVDSVSNKIITFDINSQQSCNVYLKVKASSSSGSGIVYLKGVSGLWIKNASFSLSITTSSSGSSQTSQQSQQTTQEQTTNNNTLPTRIKNIYFISYPSLISIEQGDSEIVSITVKNTGNITLINLTLSISGINTSWVSISPMTDLSPDKTHTFTINITIPENAKIEKRNIKFIVLSGDFNKSVSSTLEILPNEKYKLKLESIFKLLKEKYQNLTKIYENYKQKGVENSELESMLNSIKTLISQTETFLNTGDYISVEEMVQTIQTMLQNANSKVSEIKKIAKEREKGRMFKIIGIIILVIVGAFLVYLLLPPPHGYEPEAGFRYIPPHHRGKPRLRKLIDEIKEIIKKFKEKLKKKEKY